MAVVGHDADGPRYDWPFRAAKLEIESPRIQCICFGGDKLSGRHKLVGFYLAFRFPCPKEVLQLLVLGAWLGGSGGACASESGVNPQTRMTATDDRMLIFFPFECAHD